MKILVIGSGKVGYALAESLIPEKHDVTIIDDDNNALAQAADHLDVMYVKGSGASISALKQAGANNADIVIAITKSDELNMLSCVISKKLGAKYTIARVRDREYANDSELLKSRLNIDYVINPERSTAGEILRLLRFPAAIEIDTFYQGRVEIIGFRVLSSDVLVGITLAEMRKRTKSDVLVCFVERESEVHIPRGDFVVLENDLVYIAGKYTDVTKFFRIIGRTTGISDRAMILGGGRTSYYLALLASRIGIKTVVIEPDENRCEQIAEDVPHATVICGDCTDQELLESENVRGMDALVALTPSDEENLMLSLLASNHGVSKVIALADRLEYVPLVNKLGVESVVSPNEITTGHILHFVRGLSGARGGAVVSMSRLLDGRIEALEFVVGSDMKHLGKKIKELPIKREVVIAVISHNGKSAIPTGDDVFHVGDDVVVVTLLSGFDELNDIFEGH